MSEENTPIVADALAHWNTNISRMAADQAVNQSLPIKPRKAGSFYVRASWRYL